MKFGSLIFLVLLVFTVNLVGDSKKKDSEFNLSEFNSFMKKLLPGGEFYSSYLEAYAPDVTLMNEESNGFAFPDNPRVSFEGESFYNFNWYVGKRRINSSLNPGSSTVILPLGSIGAYRLRGENPSHLKRGLEFEITPKHEGSELTVSGVKANMGGYFRWAKFLITSPAIDRDEKLYNSRRKIDENYYLDYSFTKSGKKGTFYAAMSWYDIKREFNDFNEFDATFGGRSKLFTTLIKYTTNKDGDKPLIDLFLIYNNKKRAEQGAEYGLLPQETGEVKRNALVLGLSYQKSRLSFGTTISFEDENIDPYTDKFNKDMKDIDGDIFKPAFKLGSFKSFTFDMDGEYRLTESSGKLLSNLFLDMRFSRLEGEEDVFNTTPIYFDNKPHQVVKWSEDGKYSNINARFSGGVNGELQLSDNSSLTGKAFLMYQRLSFDYSDNNLNLLAPGIDLGLTLFKKKRKSLKFALGLLPVEVRENVNSFLETQRPSGEVYYWKDLNGNNTWEAGEEGKLYGYTGGKHHSKGSIKAPLKYRFLVEYTTPMSKNWVFRAKGIFNKIVNSLSVRHPEEYGFYETHGEYDLYFYDKPIKEYMLTNGNYDRDPMSAQLLFEIKGGVEKKWFFHFSFLTHFILGNTAFGNGPATNDIGVIDESSANPNSWINSYGRVDGDRAFMGKLYAGFFITRNLSLGISVKYRDGDPFAFINSVNAHNQYAMYYTTIKALDEKGSGDGPREDYVGDISLKLTWFFKIFGKDASLSGAVFNLMDIGYELSEYAFDTNNKRYPNELNIPRTLRLTFNMKF